MKSGEGRKSENNEQDDQGVKNPKDWSGKNCKVLQVILAGRGKMMVRCSRVHSGLELQICGPPYMLHMLQLYPFGCKLCEPRSHSFI